MDRWEIKNRKIWQHKFEDTEIEKLAMHIIVNIYTQYIYDLQ